MNGENKNWWLVTTKPRQEEYAEANLLNQGYETYRPLAKRLRKQRGKMKPTIESLFPRYLFIHLDQLNDNWAPIRSTYGVSKIVSFGNKPAKVPDEIITQLKKEEDQLAEKAIDLDRFKKGETIKIENGAFKGLNALFLSYDGEERAIVLLNILQNQTKLTVPAAEISSI